MEFKIKKLSDQFKITGVANVHFFEFENNFETVYDKHPFYELVFVSSGTLTVIADEYKGALEKYEIIIHRPNENHSLLSSDSSATVIIIGFTCEGMPENFLSKPLKLSENNVKKLAEAVKEGRSVFEPPHNVPVYDMKKNKNQPYGAEQMLKLSLEYFFISIIREHFVNESLQDVTYQRFNASEIVRYLDDKYKEKITLNELSFIFGTNRTTLCKEFKNVTGTTVSEYVSTKKLEDAKRKIIDTNATFTEISNLLNFESIHYFTRFFKKRTGLSPKEYRNKYQVKK
ncbi:MAG: helix-turn-helix transcriptional regulator [Clostridia bacterium]|nr:helix-turn-helix transcriptional regulator [Clostridia bacterium]